DKDELMRGVWPDRVVEENTLQAHISALRKAFGVDRDLIRTVAGRGYQFTGRIRSAADRAGPAPGATLPEPVSELLVRDAPGRGVVALARGRRLVPLAGAGGIGK